MKKIYCFGNPDLVEDSYALELADELGKDKSLNKINKKLNQTFEFIKCTPPDFLLSINEKEIIIIDVVKGISKVEIIKDIDKLKETKTSTMHDFDLCTVLKLLKETGKLKNLTIIGVPQNIIPHNSSKYINKNETIKQEIVNYLLNQYK